MLEPIEPLHLARRLHERGDAAVHALGRRFVLAGRAAARIPVLPVWPVPDMAEVGALSRGRVGTVSRAGCPFSIRVPACAADPITVGGYRISAPAETILRAGACSPFPGGLALVDAALRSQTSSLRLPSREELRAAEQDVSWRGGRPKLRRILELASPLSGSIGESISRAVMYEFGFLMPALQSPLHLPNGHLAYPDFTREDAGIVGEFDGRMKYGRAVKAAQSTEQALIKERDRELRILETGYSMVRWKWETAVAPARLVDHLERHGVPRPLVQRPI